MTVYEALTEQECYLYAILKDVSGIDQAEFGLTDETAKDKVFRAWPFQFPWYRCSDELQIDSASRSIGKSLSIQLRALAFPFVHPGEEMLITAPEGIHLDAVTDNIETIYSNNTLAREMIAAGRGGVKHRPFLINFSHGGKILGRIPHRDGSGVKGQHPRWLEMDEACFPGDTLILTDRGHVPIADVVVGDSVVSHTGRWKKVTAVLDRGVRDVVTVKGQGHYGLTVTPNHRFWAQRITKWHDSRNRWGVKGTSDFEWTPAAQLEDTLWSSPTRLPEVLPPSHIPRSKTGRSYEIDTLSQSFLWCLGLYIAEGSTSSAYGAGEKLTKSTWSIHKDEVEYVTEKLTAAGLNWFVQPVQNSENCLNVVVAHVGLADFLDEHCGHGCHNKKIPLWVHSLDQPRRQAVFDGLIYGDGTNIKDERYAEGRAGLSTTSKALVYDFRILAQSLNRYVGVYRVEPRTTTIRGNEVHSGEAFVVRVGSRGYGFFDDGLKLDKVKSVTEEEIPIRVYDLTVEDDHSFVAEGIVVHNSDYPEPGWAELFETLKQDSNAGSTWRSHGVTRGIGGTFDEKCKPDSEFTSHRLPAMYRPTWDDDERKKKVALYNSAENPDYKRNILGLPGDSQSPIFVLSRLMRVTDTDEGSTYNTEEYMNLSIDDSMVEDVGDIRDLIDPPISHTRNHKRFWIGMDVGWVQAPSAIVVFGEEVVNKKTRLRLLSRVLLTRVRTEDQVKVIFHLTDIYRPQAFAVDATGAGFPLLQIIQNDIRENPDLKGFLDRIKGYNFSEKIVADFDDSIEIDEDDPDGWKAAIIKKNVKEFSTDVVRGLVDDQQLVLPFDRLLIGEFQGQTWSNSKSALDAYGRRRVYCTDPDTEILTKRGWLKHDQLEVGDYAWSYLDVGKADWSRVTKVNRFDGPDTMVRMKSNTFDALVTPDHKWPVERLRTNSRRTDYWWHYKGLYETDSFPGTSRYRIPTAGRGQSIPHTPIYDDSLVALAGWFMSEGTWDSRSGSASLNQSIQKNRQHCLELEKLMKQACGSDYGITKGYRLWSYRIHKRSRGFEFLRNICDPVTKLVSYEFLLSLTEPQLWIFCDACIKADGWWSQSSEQLSYDRGQAGSKRYPCDAIGFSQNVRARTEAFTMALGLLGLAYSFGDYKTPESFADMVSCRLKFSQGAGLTNIKQEVVPYHEDIVWCPTTEAGTWFARRNNTTYFTGNSSGDFHSLDATRMALLAYQQNAIDAFIKAKEDDGWEPPDMIFL